MWSAHASRRAVASAAGAVAAWIILYVGLGVLRLRFGLGCDADVAVVSAIPFAAGAISAAVAASGLAGRASPLGRGGAAVLTLGAAASVVPATLTFLQPPSVIATGVAAIAVILALGVGARRRIPARPLLIAGWVVGLAVVLVSVVGWLLLSSLECGHTLF